MRSPLTLWSSTDTNVDMKMPPEMVLFDCDGVLVDSESLTAQTLCADLRLHGLDISIEQLSDLFLGGTIMGVAKRARDMGAALPDDWIDRFYQKMFAVLAADVEAIAGIEFVLDQLDRAGILYAIGSNGPHRKMEITLTKTGLMQRFDGRVYSREDVPTPKPAPDVYLKAAADAGIAPERCVVIEDSPNGALAGKAAGMLCFGFAADTPAERLNPICDHVFKEMRELPGLLGL
ncbi:MAG: HAD family phosphatase [Roseobacter sp.]